MKEFSKGFKFAVGFVTGSITAAGGIILVYKYRNQVLSAMQCICDKDDFSNSKHVVALLDEWYEEKSKHVSDSEKEVLKEKHYKMLYQLLNMEHVGSNVEEIANNIIGENNGV